MDEFRIAELELAARPSTPTGWVLPWPSVPDRLSMESPAAHWAESTNWSGMTPMAAVRLMRKKCRSRSGFKSTWPGRNQVSRIGAFREDVIHLEDKAPLADGRSLLQLVLRNGELISGVLPSLGEIRERAAASLRALPDEYKQIEHPPTYPVRYSDRLEVMRNRAIKQHGSEG